MSYRLRLSSLVVSCVVALAACGGGEDGTAEPVASVPLSAANYQSVTESVVGSVTGADSLLGSVDLVTAAAARQPQVLLNSAQPEAIASFALTQMRQLTASKKLQSQAVYSEVEPCFSGSLQVVADDADNNDAYSTGDRLTLTAANCVVAEGVPAINGQLSLVLGPVSLDAYGDVISGKVTMTVTNFSADGVSLNGSAVISINSDSVSLDFNKLTASDGSGSLVYDYAITVYSNGSAVIDGPITINGSTYTLSTPVVIVLGYENASEGTVRIVDGHGSRVDVVLAPSGYTSSLYLKGDEVVDASTTISW